MALMLIYWLQICCKINQSTATLHGVRNHPSLLYLHQKPFQTNVADINEVTCVKALYFRNFMKLHVAHEVLVKSEQYAVKGNSNTTFHENMIFILCGLVTYDSIAVW